MAKVLVGPFGKIEEIDLPDETLCAIDKPLSLYGPLVVGRRNALGIITALQEVLELVESNDARSIYHVVGYIVETTKKDGRHFVKLTKPHRLILPTPRKQ